MAMAMVLTLAPSVAVEVEPPEEVGEGVDPALRQWLVERFLEEGVEVTPRAAEADAHVELRGARGGGLLVSVDGAEFRIDSGEPAVMRLEVWHRARRATEGGDAASHNALLDPRRVTVERTTPVPDAVRGLLEVRLLAAGYAIAPATDPGAATVCIAHADTSAEFRVAGPRQQCPETSMELSYATMRRPAGLDPLTAWIDRTIFGQAQPVVQATDDERAPTRSPRSDEEGEGDYVSASDGPTLRWEDRRPWKRGRGEFRLGVDGGVLVRGKPDGTMRAKLRLGMVPGPGGVITVGVTPSYYNDASVVDTVLSAGPDVAVRFKKDVGIEAMVALGAEIHTYRIGSDSGGSVDLHAALPLSVSWPLTAGSRMYAVAAGGFSRGRREHGDADDVRWSRTAWSVRAGLGISYGWRIP
jgi:hypothetical protein